MLGGLWVLSIQIFLSTLSLRRATRAESGQRHSPDNFYPRSPCGERPDGLYFLGRRNISIHALLAESDLFVHQFFIHYNLFLSTLSLRRATESMQDRPEEKKHFYPRSPCGERRYILAHEMSSQDFYPRSPCGERHMYQYERCE